jgi:pyruvate dehydrogenase (quinone)
VLEAVVDPEVPPLPPHITFDQAKRLALAVARGDAARKAVLDRSLKEKLRELVPGR